MQRQYLRGLLLGLMGLWLVSGSTGCALQLLGPTTANGYFFTLEVTPQQIWLRTIDEDKAARFPNQAECVVRVQDAQGRPVDGVLVTFTLAPDWEHSATLAPSQSPTRDGIARAIVQAKTTGIVRLFAQVDQVRAPTSLTVMSYEGITHHQ